MKNRNKRFTSVLAATMALGTVAPAFATVAPVFAYDLEKDDTSITDADWPIAGSTVVANVNESNMVYSIYEAKVNDIEIGTPNVVPYVAVLTGTGIIMGGTLTVPSKVSYDGNDVPVVAIAPGALNYAQPSAGQQITDVVIEGDANNPMLIGDNAFSALTSTIRNISLSNVKAIGNSAFSSATQGNIRSVTFEGNKLKAIGEDAFANNPGITSIDIPSTVTYIAAGAFDGTKLKGKISLPEGIEYVGPSAFASKDNITIVWPTINGKSKNFVTGDASTSIFGTTSGNLKTNQYKIDGAKPSGTPMNVDAVTLEYFAVTPSIWVTDAKPVAASELETGIYKDQKNKTVKVILGKTAYISVFGAGTLTIDGEVADTFVTSGLNTYQYVTPQLGKHTVVFKNSNGERSITMNVVSDANNEWLNRNLKVPTWHLGDPNVTPTGAVAKYGDVTYVYSSSLGGTYNAERPNFVGTWYVKAIVNATAEYTGLTLGPVAFKVLPAEAVKDGWVQNGSNWQYKENGEILKNVTKKIGKDTYRFDSEGNMVTGWYKESNGTYMFFDKEGHAKEGWLNDNGTWFYFKDLKMVTNQWVEDKGKEYFLADNGCMAASQWLKKDNNWVYVDNSGALKKGWLGWNMNWYYLDPTTGYMWTSGTVDGWNIQSNGVAVKA